MKTLISPDEAVAQARQILRERIALLLTEADKRKYLVVDIESGDYELDANEDFADDRLRERRPDGVFVTMRGDGGPVGQLGSVWGLVKR